LRIVILISTGGGVISKLLEMDYFKEKICEVISDRECGAINIAKEFGIKSTVLPSSNGNEFSEKLLKYINISKTDLFISFYTKLFNKNFVNAAKNKIINLHPSILPSFSGTDGFGDTTKSGSKFIGTTIHFVDEGIDTGLPIIQSAIPFNRNKTIEENRHAIFIDQCKTLLQAVKWFEDKRIEVKGKIVEILKANYETAIYSPSLDFNAAIKLNVPYKKGNTPFTGEGKKSDDNIIDLRGTTNHPVSFLYGEIYKNALLNGKIIDGRSQPGFGLLEATPFVEAAKAGVEFGIQKDGVLEVIHSTLENYYNLVQPKSAAEWLGLCFEENHILAQSPPWSAVFPWRARTVESYRMVYEKAAISENKVSDKKLDISDGWLFCGPVSYDKCRVEAIRIHYVLKKISREGYQRWDSSEGDVKATALVKESGEWRWLITAGNHRASAASALGYKEIPIRVNLVINRNQVDYWPHVVDGLYSREDALKIFDNIFEAKTTPLIEKWSSQLKNISEIH
jgi:folate-dependent phosphoribosylglycinamide formyltransferase PurN